MIIHDHHDALLTETVYTDAEELTSGVINITETGGSEAADLILTAPAADQTLTLKVEGAAEKDGEFSEQLSFTTEPGVEFSYRDRIPKYCPQYIRLVVELGGSAPSEPVGVTLRVGV